MGSIGTLQRAWKLCLLVAVVVLGMSSIALAKKAPQPTSGIVYAGVTHVEDETVIVAGDFKDSLLGKGAIVYETELSEGEETGSILVEAKRITIYTRKGSLTGKGKATQTFNDDGTSTVTDGVFKLKKGTGEYKDHKFKGTFAGDYAEGVYTFEYEAIFK